MESKQRIDSTSRHHGHHKHHRHHRHGRNKKPLVIGIIVAAVAVALGSASVVNQLNRRKNYHVTGTNSVDVGAGYRYTEYNGKKYQYNNRVTTLLYAGLDSFDELKQTATYGDKARADSIMLIVLDEVSKKMSVVAINRDTMTEVHRFSRNGDDLGVVLVYKCRQKKLNSLYYKKKEQRRCSTWRKIKNRILRNSSSRSSISTMPEVPHILNWNMNMA